MFAQRINRITPSATLEMTAKAAALRSKGIDVLNLSVGEPDFNTPLNIIQAANEAMQKGITKYTPGSGTMDLKQAISKKVLRDNHLKYEPENIIVSCGGKHALYNACQVLFEKGDEVIIFTPYWVSFPDFVLVTGATPIFVKTIASKQYEPDFKDLKNKITNKTKGIIINSPSNPTGGVWSDNAIQMTLDIAEHHNMWVFSDECYEQLVYNGAFKSIATFSNKKDTLNEKGKILTFQSCSKTYAMTGWRIGYTCGDSEVIKAMSKLQGQSTSCPNSISQYAAITALSGDQSEVLKMKNIFQKRRNLIVKLLNDIPNISCFIPQGAFYVFPDISYFINKSYRGTPIKSSLDLSTLILNESYVASVAGLAFGQDYNIRFSYATSETIIEEAINRISMVFSEIK